MNTPATQPGSLWIIGRRADLLWIFGGAYLSLLLVLPLYAWPASVPVVFWLWALCLDGPHIWATYSRTYCDRYFLHQHPYLAGFSLLWLILPLTLVYLSKALNQPWIFELFLALALLWAFYHIVRQHYGFVSLYDRKQNTPRHQHRLHGRLLYLGLWIPYVHFISNHPRNRIFYDIDPSSLPAAFEPLIFWTPIVISSGVGIVLIYLLVRSHFRSIALWFTFSCLFSQAIIFYGVVHLEPLYQLAQKPAEYFMTVTVLSTLFHNLQYLAIVWLYNHRSYAADADTQRSLHGLAVPLNLSLRRFLVAGVVFASVYTYLEWHMGEYPSLNGVAYASEGLAWAIGLWWGLSLHHYYLDQKIWRTGSNPVLRSTLVDRLG